MSNKQAKSSNYLIPVALIVLSLITSVLLSQVFQQDGADSAPQVADQGDSSTEPVSSASEDEGSEPLDESVSVSEPETETSDEEVASADEDPQQAGEVDGAAASEEQADVSLISDLSVLVPANDSLCNGQSPWMEGEQSISESSGSPGCYGLRFKLSSQATVLLLKLGDSSDPRSMLAENCRPFGFNSAQFEPEKVQRLPRGVDSQPGVFQVGAEPAQTRFILVAAKEPKEQMNSLAGGVANLCGQSASLSNAQVQEQLDALAQLEGVSVEEVQAKL
ncbi:hypothetical protein [Marinobacter sp. CHS3-4]|uniref:hypothetical protein n=1 Tax=Marinobacter sp. CHS3-4 TaxID=3045174 RepID=UPI0024B5C9BD|nr:hypothetical protein [Marinobacter sp. CHS3-4]MDI9245948.1 hypothetical protein [Marinobacter sp. CHS3-4]